MRVAVADAGKGEPDEIQPGRRREPERQQAHRAERDDSHLVDGQRLGRFGGAHAADCDGDAGDQDRIGKREKGAHRQRPGSGMRHDEDADKPDDQRRPAVQPDLFLQDQARQQRREERRRKADRDRRAERQQAKRHEHAGHRAELRQPALQMLAVAVGAQHGEPGARQDHPAHREKREGRAEKRHLADRVERHLPFDDRIDTGEHHRRQNHVEDAARDLIAPRDERIWGGHQALFCGSADWINL